MLSPSCDFLAQTLLFDSTNMDKQPLFHIGSPNCILYSGKCDSKENHKSDLDLDLRFVNRFIVPVLSN